MCRFQLLPIIALLLLHFFIRTHNILILEPYIDEGFHVSRAATAWDFVENPGSEGKFLLYYWLGIFEAPSTQSLAPARLSIAIFSLLSGATIFLLGRWLINYKTGLVALGLYTIFPLAYFLERMAMADPFAATLAVLLAWRSLVFAKYPSMLNAVSTGVLMALVTMAKLTMGLVPLLPIVASIIYWNWGQGNFISQSRAWLKTYFLPLGIAGFSALLCWSPILIPTYLNDSLEATYESTADPGDHTFTNYFWGVLPIVSEFTTRELLLVALVAVGYCLGRGRQSHVRLGVYLLIWLLAMALPTLYAATLITSRYIMPLSAPIILMIAYFAVNLWEKPLLRIGVFAAAAFWVLSFAYPFARDTVNDPLALPLTETSAIEYLSGSLSGDIAIQRAGVLLSELDPAPERIYVNWSTCPLLYFYTEQELTCLDRYKIMGDLTDHLRREMDDCSESVFVVSGYSDAVLNIRGVAWEEIAIYQRARVNRPVKMWWASWGDRCPETPAGQDTSVKLDR